MTKHVTIREAAASLNVSPDTIRRRLRAGALSGMREQTPQGFVWYVELPDATNAPPTQSPTQTHMLSPMRDGVSDALAAFERQLTIKDEQIATQARMMEAMREEHARTVEQLHVLLQTAQQNEQRLLSATVPDDLPRGHPHAPERSAGSESPAPTLNVAPAASQRDSEALRSPPRRSWWARLLGGE